MEFIIGDNQKTKKIKKNKKQTSIKLAWDQLDNFNETNKREIECIYEKNNVITKTTQTMHGGHGDDKGKEIINERVQGTIHEHLPR